MTTNDKYNFICHDVHAGIKSKYIAMDKRTALRIFSLTTCGGIGQIKEKKNIIYFIFWCLDGQIKANITNGSILSNRKCPEQKVYCMRRSSDKE